MVRYSYGANHRFALLGILDENGIPVEDMGIVAYDAENVLPLRIRAAGVIDIRVGKRCPECGNHAVIRKDGCDFRSACGAVGRMRLDVWRRCRLQECEGSRDATLRRACQPLPWRGATRVWPPCQGSGAGLMAGPAASSTSCSRPAIC